jgi:hypothetical protein
VEEEEEEELETNFLYLNPKSDNTSILKEGSK